MNDRFKFRAWERTSKQMYYDNLVVTAAGDIVPIDDDGDFTVAKDYNFMPCTGLKDKNGMLIYEGDIVSGINGSINGSGMEFKTIIKWNNDNCCFNTPKFGSNENSTHWYEIIGNIYENPELLDVENENFDEITKEV